ncbi:alpha/beta fold hydrolase [Kocuria palustris]|uniref:alpha/beta fold hydrolase n=1 Tax=Kocuria palustris TaxID=71999 RepID=UPI0011A9A4DA|nr:alpha/beta hydrolase [Kocuria palustris]
MSDSLPEPRGGSRHDPGSRAPGGIRHAPGRRDADPDRPGARGRRSAAQDPSDGPDGWREDVLGPGFLARRLPVPGRGAHDAATLVRHVPRLDPEHDPQDACDEPRGTVVYVHGWSDYFANPELARAVSAAGFRFYALDLHGYGRALTDDVLAHPEVPGYAESMREYRGDLEAAVRAAAHDGAPAQPGQIVWLGHSTGGLVVSLAALTAAEPPAGIALAAPWIAPHVHDLAGRALVAALRLVPRRWHDRQLPLRVAGHYFRSLSSSRDGEWPLDPRWRPETSFPLTVGFLLAAHEGHLRLLDLHRRGAVAAAPVLLQISRRSLILPWWCEAMKRRDTVLDVGRIRRRIGALSPVPRVISYDGALHDVHRSAPEVRRRTFEDLSDWLGEVARRIAADGAPDGPGPGR